MTALPKHWPSSRRQGRRRATITGPKLAQVTKCLKCGQDKRPGFLCQNCEK